MKKHKGFKFIAMIFIVAAIVALVTLVVMTLWNWLIPSIFVAGPEITYWQALGVLVLSKILFGGFKHHPKPPFSSSSRAHWKNKFSEKWSCMDPEKKEKIKKHIHSKFSETETDENDIADKTE